MNKVIKSEDVMKFREACGLHQSKMLEFDKALTFISDHPALISDVFRSGLDGLSVRTALTCKRGLEEYDPIFLYPNDVRFEEFIDYPHKNYDEDGNVTCIWVHYKPFYGEEWELDSVKVTVEAMIARYVRPEFPCYDHTIYGDLKVTAPTYEEAIIKLASNLKKNCGDYSAAQHDDNTIVPKWVADNNKVHRPYTPDTLKSGWMTPNPNFIQVKKEEISELWWQLHKPNITFLNGTLIDVSKYLNGDPDKNGN